MNLIHIYNMMQIDTKMARYCMHLNEVMPIAYDMM